MSVISIRLQDAMTLRGLSASDLARASGVSNAQLTNYKQGKYEPKAETIRKLAYALNVSEEWLAGKNVPMFRKPQELPDDQSVRVALFGGDEEVTDAEWEEVRQFVAFIKSKRGEKN